MTAADSWLRHDGMTIREVARALRISSARVKQLEQAALRKIAANPGLLLEFVDYDTTRPEEGPHR